MALLLSFILGFVLLNAVSLVNANDRRMLLVFSLPLGMGLSSLIVFYALLFFKETYLVYAIFIHFIIILFLLIYRRSTFLNKISAIRQLNFKLQFRHYVLISVFLLFLLFSIVFIKKYPYGFWDAFTMWNLKAKFMFYENANWPKLIRCLTHPDYPLLLPLNIFWGWGIVGGDYIFVPIAISLGISLSILFILFVFVLKVSKYKTAVLSVLFAISAPRFIKTINYQFADSLLSCYILIAGICFLLALDEKKKIFAWLGGFSTGAACFTKNEGLLFFIVLYCVLFFYHLANKDRKYILGVIIYSLVGCLPFLITLFIFKKIANMPNDILDISRINNFPNLIFDYSRIKIILYSSLKETCRWALFFYCFLAGLILNFKNFFKNSAKVITITVFLVTLGDFFVYLVSPRELQRHLDSSLFRLIFHLFPLLIILLFYCSFTKEKIL